MTELLFWDWTVTKEEGNLPHLLLWSQSQLLTGISTRHISAPAATLGLLEGCEKYFKGDTSNETTTRIWWILWCLLEIHSCSNLSSRRGFSSLLLFHPAVCSDSAALSHCSSWDPALNWNSPEVQKVQTETDRSLDHHTLTTKKRFSWEGMVKNSCKCNKFLADREKAIKYERAE